MTKRLAPSVLAFSLCWFAAALTPLIAAQIEVGMEPQEITLGDPVVVEIAVTPPAGTQTPIFPDWSTGTWGRAEILEVGELQLAPAGPGENRFSQRLVLTAFEVGEIELPPVTIEFPRSGSENQSSRSDAYLLTVRTVVPPEVDLLAAEPRPPAALRRVDTGKRFWWTVALLALLGAALTALLLRAIPELRPAAPQLDPLDEFDDSMRTLGGETDPILFHTRLSLAFREFLGRTLAFGATESTTTEIQSRLRQHHLTNETIRHTTQLLRDCDQVKFARMMAERRSTQETLSDAGRLARSVYRDIRPDDTAPPAVTPTTGAPRAEAGGSR